MKKEQAQTGKSNKDRYESLVRDFSVEDLRDILSILSCEPKILISQLDENKIAIEKRSKADQEQLRKRWLTLFTFEQDRYGKLMGLLDKKFDIFTEEKVSNQFYEATIFPKIPLLIEVIQSKINLIETGEEIPAELRIKKIECFTSATSNRDYQIVINGDYFKPISVTKKDSGAWSLFMELVENGYLPITKETRYLYDYLNFNPNNKITTNTNFPRQVIIEQKGGQYVPTFAKEVLTEKALTQRQSKLEKHT